MESTRLYKNLSTLTRSFQHQAYWFSKCVSVYIHCCVDLHTQKILLYLSDSSKRERHQILFADVCFSLLIMQNSPQWFCEGVSICLLQYLQGYYLLQRLKDQNLSLNVLHLSVVNSVVLLAQFMNWLKNISERTAISSKSWKCCRPWKSNSMAKHHIVDVKSIQIPSEH